MPDTRSRAVRPTAAPIVLATLILALAAALGWPLGAAAEGGADAAATATRLPVDEAQAELGAAGYAQHCALCHGQRLEGMDHFPTLVGTTFQRRWAERTLGELHTYVHDTMPLGAGGTLDDETYAAVVAYLLVRNGVEPGEVPFDPDDDAQLELPLTLGADDGSSAP